VKGIPRRDAAKCSSHDHFFEKAANKNKEKTMPGGIKNGGSIEAGKKRP